MTKKRIIILGAGLSGLSAAWHLQEKGLACQVFEKESGAGGLCRSKNIDGFTFDYDGHLLHFRHKYTFNLVKNLLGSNLAEHERSAWIYFNGTYTRYPFQANLYGLPSSVIKECVLGFIEANRNGHAKKKNSSDFLNWIKQTFGEGIARHFMIPYNTKFWTVPPQELNCAWLDGFIPVPSLREVIEGTIEENQRQFGYNARFWYPRKGGIDGLSLALAAQIKNLHNNCQITQIDLNKKEIKMTSGESERFDSLISTIPLPEIPHLIKGLPNKLLSLFAKLKWNSIFNLNLGIDRAESRGRHWIYFPHQDTCFFRVGFFHNFSADLTPQDKSSMYVEVSYSRDKPIDKDNIIPRIKKDLEKVGILHQNEEIYLEDINDIKYGYPIYDRNYNEARAKILKFLSTKSIISCGRYGSWRYMSMEDALIDGKNVASKL
jgi:UDP-galactopyranose mutase